MNKPLKINLGAKCELCHQEHWTKKNDIIFCDNPQCNRAYHFHCLNPKLTHVPSEAWFCPLCRVTPKLVVPQADTFQYAKGPVLNKAAMRARIGLAGDAPITDDELSEFLLYR